MDVFHKILVAKELFINHKIITHNTAPVDFGARNLQAPMLMFKLFTKNREVPELCFGDLWCKKSPN